MHFYTNSFLPEDENNSPRHLTTRYIAVPKYIRTDILHIFRDGTVTIIKTVSTNTEESADKIEHFSY
jgi:hypothetical protein